MADPLKQICDELGVCTEEALFYLEGFRWDLTAAMEACRSKTLPSPSLTPQPPSSENEKTAAEEQTRDEKISRFLPSTSLTDQPPSSENERSAAEEQTRDEKISTFLAVASGSSVADAVKYLSDNNWNIDHAAASFCEHRYDPPKKKPKPNPWYLDGFSGDGVPALVQDVLSQVPQFRNNSTSLSIGSPPSASTPRLELSQESIKEFLGVASEASSQAVIDCLNKFKGNVQDAIDYFFDEYEEAPPGIATAEVVKNFSGMDVDQDPSTEHIPEGIPLVTSSQVEESGNPTETLPLKGEESDEVKEEHIRSFIETTGRTREDAISALSMSLMENKDASSGPTETQRSSEKGGEGDVTVAIPGMAKAPPVKIQGSSSPTQTREVSGTSLDQLEHDELIDFFVDAADGITRDDATAYLTKSNWDVNKAFSCLFEKTSKVQASEEGESGSSSSSSDADSTDTGKATAASSQVDEDENVKDNKDVEEDLGTELSAVPITTTRIELEIILDDGRSKKQIWIFVRSDDTVGDIRKRIDAFRPEDKREYYLKSDTGVEYRDLDTTMHSITSGSRGSTILHQMYSS